MLRRNFAFLICAAAFAATVPTIDQSLATQAVSGAEISPDGKYIAYLVQQANWDENDFVSQIWIASTDSGKRYRLTGGKKSSTAPQWSPDSKRIAFTSDRDGKRQIYLISPTGGEAIALTAEKTASARCSGRPTELGSRSPPPGLTRNRKKSAKTSTAIFTSSKASTK